MSVLDRFKLTGKNAIITGGSRGLGAAIAEAYAELGANIVICSRDLQSCEEKATYLKNTYDVQTLALACDVTNQSQVQKVVEQTVEKLATIDILVNNSGASWAAPTEKMPLDAWNKVMEVNVTGTFLMSQAVGKVMLNQKQGKIINIASTAGLGGTPNFMQTIGYNTSKGAIITFTKDLAVKWGPHNIHVNAIAPGFIPTKMSEVLIEYGKEEILKVTPLNRIGTDEDLKGAAIFLASDASNYVTGDVLIVDGGGHAL
ncbi:MAG TPA: SDR family oxidoreductase [Pseudogracilibacillus sp.]|mgnify:CR=1 FL=1|nr:SDR family oxidoreductase [Pseudogracilibacillus sp.]